MPAHASVSATLEINSEAAGAMGAAVIYRPRGDSWDDRAALFRVLYSAQTKEYAKSDLPPRPLRASWVYVASLATSRAPTAANVACGCQSCRGGGPEPGELRLRGCPCGLHHGWAENVSHPPGDPAHSAAPLDDWPAFCPKDPSLCLAFR
jgi:hypothetical protein